MDYYDIGGAFSRPFRIVPLELPGRRRQCTLARGSPALDAEGLPSNSVDRQLALVPCYNVAPGVRGVIAFGNANKSLGEVKEARGLTAIHHVPIGGGLRGATSGFRQVASLDGSAFYTASIAARDFGIRYFVRGATTSVHIAGSQGQSPPDGLPRGGTNDIRSLAFARLPPRLHAVSSPLDAGWDTIYSICASRECNATVPVLATGVATQLLPPLTSAWTFVFDGMWSVWVSMVNATGSAQLRHYVNLVRISGQQARRKHWVPSYTKADFPAATGPLRSLTGRSEPYMKFGSPAAKFVLYACDATTVFRVDTLSKIHTVVAAAPANALFRGVVLPPSVDPTPTPTPSPARTGTGTPSKSTSKSRTPKARK